jgi:hypothetical protein
MLKFNQDLLIKLVKQYNTKCNISKYKNIKRTDKVEFICKCGEKYNKTFRQIHKTGMICRQCCSRISCKRRGINRWTEKSVHKYLLKYTFFWNITQLLLTKNKNEYKWKIPQYRWWNKYHSGFCGNLIRKKIKFQNLLDTYGQKTRRLKNELKDEAKLIDKIRKIYEKEGIGGLHPTKLNSNYAGIYNTYIYKLKQSSEIEKDYNNHGPCKWCCDKLDIMNERKTYLKKISPYYCNFEEICELHIRPNLEKLFEDKLDSYLVREDFQKIGKCGIPIAWTKLGKNIFDVRKYFNLEIVTNHKYISFEGLICDSIGECIIYNFLHLRNIDITPGQVYPKEYQNKYNSKSIDDGRFWSPIKNKLIIMEIWGWWNDKNNKDSKIIRYLEKKKKKEEFWKNYQNDKIDFFPIKNDAKILNTKHLTSIFEPYIGLITPKKITFQDKIKYFNREFQDKYKQIIKRITDNPSIRYCDFPPNLISFIDKQTKGLQLLKNELGIKSNRGSFTIPKNIPEEILIDINRRASIIEQKYNGMLPSINEIKKYDKKLDKLLQKYYGGVLNFRNNRISINSYNKPVKYYSFSDIIDCLLYYKKYHGCKYIKIPSSYVIPDTCKNKKLVGMKLGVIYGTISCLQCYVKIQTNNKITYDRNKINKLVEIGFVFNFDELVWNLIKKGLVYFKQIYGHVNVPKKFCLPKNLFFPELSKFPLGAKISGIRINNNFINQEFIGENIMTIYKENNIPISTIKERKLFLKNIGINFNNIIETRHLENRQKLIEFVNKNKKFPTKKTSSGLYAWLYSHYKNMKKTNPKKYHIDTSKIINKLKKNYY